MGTVEKRSRLSIDIPTDERLWLKMLATSQNRSINDLVLSCIRAHFPCRKRHVPNAKTAAQLDASERINNERTFESPLELFAFLGLPTTCLNKKSPKASSVTLKKRGARKKI